MIKPQFPPNLTPLHTHSHREPHGLCKLVRCRVLFYSARQSAILQFRKELKQHREGWEIHLYCLSYILHYIIETRMRGKKEKYRFIELAAANLTEEAVSFWIGGLYIHCWEKVIEISKPEKETSDPKWLKSKNQTKQIDPKKETKRAETN